MAPNERSLTLFPYNRGTILTHHITAEALAALSLASNIVQLVDFGIKLLAGTYDALKSVDGSNKQNAQIEEHTKHLRTLYSTLCGTQRPATTTENERLLLELANESEEVAKHLLNALKELKFEGQGRWRSLRSFLLQIKGLRKARSISAMQEELNRIQAQVNTCLLSVLRDGQSSLKAALQEIMKASSDNHDRLQGMIEKVIALTTERKQDMSNLRQAIDSLLRESRDLSRTRVILESLCFDDMYRRRTDIKDAHQDTFSWIFEDDTTPFKTWLGTSNGTFWVSGKAGSGKSTLMKFLSQHPRTREILRAWAGSAALVVAEFYFWHAGTPMQNNEQGLLQSLLYTILRDCQSLIPIVCATRWNDVSILQGKPVPWSRKELSAAFKDIVRQGRLKVSCCFFIDGLDEYTGEHETLVSDLADLAKSPDVKICVSSRPWNVFRAAYGQSKDRMFVLQDLTKNDMDLYIKDQLEEDSRFLELSRREPSAAQQLTMDLRLKAQGVFLWVFLVVRNLREGLMQHDNVNVLRKRLENLPSELKDYFEHMFKTMDKTYQVYTARALLLALHASEPLPLLSYYFLCHDVDDPFSFEPTELRGDPPTTSELVQMETEGARLVNSWCKDLLEPSPLSTNEDRTRETNSKSALEPCPYTALDSYRRLKVDVLHRTVKEYLTMPHMQELLQKEAGDFDRSRTLMLLFIAKTTLLSAAVESATRMAGFLSLARKVMVNARNAKPSPDTHSLLKSFNIIGDVLYNQIKLEGLHDQTESYRDPDSRRHWSMLALVRSHLLPCSEFFAYALNFGVLEYVKEELREVGRFKADSRALTPLYYFATQPVFDGTSAGFSNTSLRTEMTKLLLQSEVDYTKLVKVVPDDAVGYMAFEKRGVDKVIWRFLPKDTLGGIGPCLMDPCVYHSKFRSKQKAFGKTHIAIAATMLWFESMARGID